MLYRALSDIWTGAGLQHGGQGPVFGDGGVRNTFQCLVSLKNISEPYVVLDHGTYCVDGRYSAMWSCPLDYVDGTHEIMSDAYYEGPAADGAALIEACSNQAKIIAGIVISNLTKRLR